MNLGCEARTCETYMCTLNETSLEWGWRRHCLPAGSLGIQAHQYQTLATAPLLLCLKGDCMCKSEPEQQK